MMDVFEMPLDTQTVHQTNYLWASAGSSKGLKIPVSAVQVRLWPPSNFSEASPIRRGFLCSAGTPTRAVE